MPLLSTAHADAIESFFAGGTLTELPPTRPAAAELRMIGDRLAISWLPTLDVATDWLLRPVAPSVAAVGIVLPVDTRGHLGAIVDRAGAADWFSIEHGRLRFDDSASCRLLDDLARSRLGLPTDPPAAGTDWFWLGCWLLALHQAMAVPDAHRDGPLLDAVSVAGWHPAIDPDELFGLDFDRLTSHVIDRHRDHAVVADWECVRLDANGDRRHPFHRLSSMLDAGAFGRWVTACDRPLSALAEPLMTGCSPLALRLIGSVIADVVLRHRVGSCG